MKRSVVHIGDMAPGDFFDVRCGCRGCVAVPGQERTEIYILRLCDGAACEVFQRNTAPWLYSDEPVAALDPLAVELEEAFQ